VDVDVDVYVDVYGVSSAAVSTIMHTSAMNARVYINTHTCFECMHRVTDVDTVDGWDVLTTMFSKSHSSVYVYVYVHVCVCV